MKLEKVNSEIVALEKKANGLVERAENGVFVLREDVEQYNVLIKLKALLEQNSKVISEFNTLLSQSGLDTPTYSSAVHSEEISNYDLPLNTIEEEMPKEKDIDTKITELFSKVLKDNKDFTDEENETLDFLESEYKSENESQQALIDDILIFAGRKKETKEEKETFEESQPLLVEEELPIIAIPNSEEEPKEEINSANEEVVDDKIEEVKPVEEAIQTVPLTETIENVPLAEKKEPSPIELIDNNVSKEVESLDSVQTVEPLMENTNSNPLNVDQLVPQEEVKPAAVEQPVEAMPVEMAPLATNRKKVINRGKFNFAEPILKKFAQIKGMYALENRSGKSNVFGDISLKISNFRLNHINKTVDQMKAEIANIDKMISDSQELATADKIPEKKKLLIKLSKIATIVDKAMILVKKENEEVYAANAVAGR